MNSIASLTRQPVLLKVDGIEQAYEIHPLVVDDFGKLQAWIDSQFPDPFVIVDLAIKQGSYTIPQQQFLMQQAFNAASNPKHPIGTPEADRLLQSMAGVLEMLKISIRKGRPEFSDDEAKKLYMHMGLGHLHSVFNATEVSLLMSDPKPPTTMPKRNGSSTSHRTRKKGSTGGDSSTGQ